MTNTYQFIFILADGDDSKLSKVEEAVEKVSAKVSKKDTWGKKTFAYLINKQMNGHYFEWTLKADTSKIKEFKSLLNLNNDLMRYLLLKEN